MLILRQSTAIDIRMGPFLDATDGVTPETGVTLGAADQAEVLKENGAATVAMGGTFAAVTGADGWYDYTVATGDVDTVGEVVFVVQDSSVCLPVYVRGYVVEEAVYDALYDASSAGPLQSTTAGRTLDVTAGGAAGIDWGNIENPTTTVDLSGTDINLVDTTTTNTDMRGTDSALLAASAPTNFGDLSITATTGRVDVAAVAGTAQTANDNGADINAILVDTGTTLPAILGTPTDFGSGTSTIAANLQDLADDGTAVYDRSTDSLQAIRDRGDTSWITGGGGGLTQILNVVPLIPPAIDLANTATYRIALALVNSLDDLPTTAEITPGTIDIDRKAIGGTSWTSVVSGAACSEAAGLVYYDEAFDSGTGYAEGDMLRFTFYSQAITADSNTHEVSDATEGRIFYSGILTSTPDVNVTQVGGQTASATATVNFDDIAAILLDTAELQGDWANGGRLDLILDSRMAEASIDTTGGAVDNVTLVATTTTNTDMRGTDSAALASALATAQTDLDTITGSDGVTLATTQGNYAPATAAAATAIETDTQDIQSRLPAALVGGRMDGNVGAISGSATSADNLEQSTLGIIPGTAQTGTLTTTACTTDLTGFADDELINRQIVFVSGTANGQGATITDYASASGLVTFSGGIATAPANGDTFVVV